MDKKIINSCMIMIKKSTLILNLNFNNMYGYASSQLLPCAGFEFVESLSMFTFDFFMNYDRERDIGCILMVEVGYSKYLQPLHRDLSFLTWKENN